MNKPIHLIFAAAFLAFLAPSFLVAAPVEIIPAGLRGAVQPQIAIAPSGRIHVVFGKDTSIYHTTSPDGRAFSEPVKIATLEKLALRMRRGPRVTATDSLVLVTAISHADGALHAWTSADDGRTWKETAPLNSGPRSAREGLQALAGDGSGLVAAVWLDNRGKGTELWGTVSHDGGATWRSESPIYRSPDGHICECCHPGVTIGPKGEIAAMWRNWLGGSRDMWWSVSTDAGKTFAAAQKLGTGTWKLKGCPMDGGGIAFDGSGALNTVWRRESAVFASGTDPAESQLADHAAQPVVAADGAKIFTAWEQAGGIQLKAGALPPRRIAAGRAPAIARSTKSGGVALAWEGEADGKPTLFCEAFD